MPSQTGVKALHPAQVPSRPPSTAESQSKTSGTQLRTPNGVVTNPALRRSDPDDSGPIPEFYPIGKRESPVCGVYIAAPHREGVAAKIEKSDTHSDIEVLTATPWDFDPPRDLVW